MRQLLDEAWTTADRLGQERNDFWTAFGPTNVIGAFSTSGITFIKMVGVGMIIMLLLDATVVRALLVPATMRLLGRSNWWAPSPLARLRDRYGHREPPAPSRPPFVSAPLGEADHPAAGRPTTAAGRHRRTPRI